MHVTSFLTDLRLLFGFLYRNSLNLFRILVVCSDCNLVYRNLTIKKSSLLFLSIFTWYLHKYLSISDGYVTSLFDTRHRDTKRWSQNFSYYSLQIYEDILTFSLFFFCHCHQLIKTTSKKEQVRNYDSVLCWISRAVNREMIFHC